GGSHVGIAQAMEGAHPRAELFAVDVEAEQVVHEARYLPVELARDVFRERHRRGCLLRRNNSDRLRGRKRQRRPWASGGLRHGVLLLDAAAISASIDVIIRSNTS